uniref:Uncharacterized protein n=1 Tax=Avena sativa TaxID=4498 RepID=A0ACD5Z200_AVESA
MIPLVMAPYCHSLSKEIWPPLPRVVEIQSKALSHDDNPQAYIVHSPDSSSRMDEGSSAIQDVEVGFPGRFSKRTTSVANDHILEKASNLCKKRDLQGNHHSYAHANAFDVLSDQQIMLRASLMGVDIPDDNFDSIDLIRELEISKNCLVDKQNSKLDNLLIEDVNGAKTPLDLEWMSQDEEGGDFTIVDSKKSRKSGRKKKVVSHRPLTRSQKQTGTSTHSPGRIVRHREKT